MAYLLTNQLPDEVDLAGALQLLPSNGDLFQYALDRPIARDPQYETELRLLLGVPGKFPGFMQHLAPVDYHTWVAYNQFQAQYGLPGMPMPDSWRSYGPHGVPWHPELWPPAPSPAGDLPRILKPPLDYGGSASGDDGPRPVQVAAPYRSDMPRVNDPDTGRAVTRVWMPPPDRTPEQVRADWSHRPSSPAETWDLAQTCVEAAHAAIECDAAAQGGRSRDAARWRTESGSYSALSDLAEALVTISSRSWLPALRDLLAVSDPRAAPRSQPIPQIPHTFRTNTSRELP